MKWLSRLVLLALLASFGAMLHYTLPQHDIVRVTGTEVVRQDFSGVNRFFFASADSGTVEGQNRDLRLINAVDANGNVRVYRNEDTGFGWPLYFKFGSANLHAEAQSVISSKDAPEWVALRHYGWRNELLSIYPNAVSMKPVVDPNAHFIPWFNILILTCLFACVWGVSVRLIRFRKAHLDPMIESLDDRFDDVRDGARSGLSRLWRKKS